MSGLNLVLASVIMLLVVCVGYTSAAAPLVRSSSSSDESRVTDFTVSESKDSVSWTAFGRQWIVQLELSDVVEDNTDYYHGTLEGDANAVVSFALLPGSGLSGMIMTSQATWWIRAMPVIENNLSEDETDLGIFMIREDSSVQASLASSATFAAPLQAEDSPVSSCSDDASSSSSIDSDSNGKRTTVSSYKLGILWDQKFATASNNPWSSQANTIGLINDVNAIYKGAGMGTYTAVFLKQITNSYTSLTDMLNYFSGTASTTVSAFTDTSYTNYIWLVGTNVGGLSYVGTSCKGTGAAQNKKTSVAGLVNYSRLWTVKTIAHELGHTRGAAHTFDDACSSTATTSCQCSIMSYCFPTATNNPNGAVNYFLPLTVTQMHTAGCY